MSTIHLLYHTRSNSRFLIIIKLGTTLENNSISHLIQTPVDNGNLFLLKEVLIKLSTIAGIFITNPTEVGIIESYLCLSISEIVHNMMR